MKYFVQIDSYPQFVDGVLSENLPMSPLYSTLMGREDIQILRIRSRILDRGVGENEIAFTPNTFISEHKQYASNVQEVYLTCTLTDCEDPEFSNNIGIISKLVRKYMPDGFGTYEVVADMPTFIPSDASGDFKDQIAELAKAPLGQLGTPIAIINMQTSDNIVHMFHLDPRSYIKTAVHGEPRKLTMYVPGIHTATKIYHPQDMKGKISYRVFGSDEEPVSTADYFNRYDLWLWRVDLFDATKRPVFNDQLHMFVRFNRTLTEASLKGYDKLTHEIFLNGGVDKYHLYVTTTNREKWIETNRKILEKLSPEMAFDWKGIKGCGESGFSYVSLRSKKFPFITPKFLELLSNGIVPLLNVWTSETMAVCDLFPTELYVQELVDIAGNIERMKDPVIFKRVIDCVYEKIEGRKQPLLEILGVD